MTTSRDRLEPSRLTEIDTWIFDVDNTLYSAGVDFFAQIDKKITAFISRYLAMHTTEARLLQKQYLIEYGTSLSGLMDVHGMDPADFLDYVHDVDLGVLKPNPKLRSAIAALPGRKLLYTNGSRGHAVNIATHLNLFDLFDGHFGIEDGHYIPKPKRAPYETFNKVFAVNPKTSIFFEDNLRNLKVPYDMGMSTVLVTSDADWSHEPEDVRPGGYVNKDIDHLDVITCDLAGWLERRTGS